MKKVFLMRHSVPEKCDLPTELIPLSIEGVNLAKSKQESFISIDRCYASCYKRAFETAKLISKKPVVVVNELHERIIGEAHEDFWLKQYQNYDYHNPGGESLNMVKMRMKRAMDCALKEMEDGETALVVSHATAICSYLLNFGQIEVDDAKTKSRIITFRDREVLRGKINPTDFFEIEYEDNEVVAIRFC